MVSGVKWKGSLYPHNAASQRFAPLPQRGLPLNAVSSYCSSYLSPYAGVNCSAVPVGNLYGSSSVFGNTSLVGTSALDSTYSLQTSLAVNNLSRSEASAGQAISSLGAGEIRAGHAERGLAGTLASKTGLRRTRALSSDEHLPNPAPAR